MNKESRIPMSPADRAKQFMPFAAVKGLSEALAKKEKIIVPRMELSDDYKEELDRTLLQIRKKDIITVVYFSQDSYVQLTGMVSCINTSAGYIRIINTKIPFKDILCFK